MVASPGGFGLYLLGSAIAAAPSYLAATDMTAPNSRERILPRLIEEEMQQSFINYSMSVIVSRALPDVRDGLKPVHRRILYAMNELGLVPGAAVQEVRHRGGRRARQVPPARRRARCTTRWSGWSRSSRCGIRWSTGRGTSARWTATRRRPTATPRPGSPGSPMAMLEDIDKNTVDFQPNFDDRLQEPTVLPAKIPNLLVNGSSGIAVGMATNIPPHNLREVAKAVELLVDNPEATIAELRKVIKGPDFPTGAYIYGREGIKEAYETGRGRVVMRARAQIEEKESSGRSQIVVTEIPYQVNKENLVEAHRRAGDGEEDRGHHRGQRRVRQGRHADGDRPQARRHPQRGAEPALQAHRDAVHLRRHHAGARQGRAEGDEPEGAARAVHRSPARGHRPPDPVRPRRGRRRGSTSSRASRSPSTTSTR